jgi:hypothetical protein
MIPRATILVAQLAIALVSCGPVQQVAKRPSIWTAEELRGDGIYYRSMVGTMSPAAFDKMAISMLGSGSVRIGSIRLYHSERDRVRMSLRKGQNECGYQDWVYSMQQYRALEEGCPVITEAIKLGDTIAVRSVDQGCRRSYRVLDGRQDPLRLSVGHDRLNVLFMSFSEIGKRNTETHAHPFLQSKRELSERDGKEITNELIRRWNSRCISVTVQKVPWFLQHCRYPVVNPFLDERPPGNLQEYLGTRYVSCLASTQWPVQCIASETVQ